MPYIGNVLTSFAVETGNINDQAVTAPKLSATGGTDGQVLALDSGGNLVWSSDPAGQWVTSGDNIFYNTGSVGIGTDSPQHKLTVDTDIGIYRASSDPTLNFSVGGTISSPTKTYRLLIDDSNSDKFQLRDDVTPRITVDGSGNVGVGTISPAQALHVAAASNDIARFESTITNGSATIELKPQSTGGLARIDVVDNACDFSISTVGKANALIIKNGGNVGIGTTIPENNLHIFTDTNAEGILVKSTGNTSNSLDFDANRTAAEGGIGAIRGKWNGTTVAQISFNTGSDTTNKDDGFISFGTESAASSGNANADEKMRLDSSGRLLVNTLSTIATGTGDKVQVAETVGANILLGRDDTSIDDANNLGQIQFHGNHGGTWRESARIQVTANGGHTASSRPGRISFQTTTATQSSPGEQMALDGNGDLQFNSGFGSVATAYGVRAWVNYSGTSNVIRDDGNVTSVTDNGDGDYTVNFTNAMVDDDFCVSVFAQGSDGTDNGMFVYARDLLATSVRVGCRTDRTTSKTDSNLVCVSIIR